MFFIFMKGVITMNQNIGKEIRRLRKEREITLADMAKTTDLSVGFLSNLENNQTSPTIAQLHKICNVLSITINDLLGTSTPTAKQPNYHEIVVRANDRRCLFEQDNGDLRYEAMTVGSTDIKTSAMIIHGDNVYSFSPHDHAEFGIVVSGSMEIQIDSCNYYLYPGDSIYIDAGNMHSAKKTSDEDCISYWCKVSPTYVPKEFQ